MERIGVSAGRTRQDRHPAQSVLRALCAAVLLLGSIQTQAGAQPTKICIPQAQGVPVFPSGPPNWLNSAGGFPQYWTALDDPRWRGAFAQTYGDGSAGQVEFRALYDATSKPNGKARAISISNLFLSW